MALFHRDLTTAFLCNSFANFFGNLLTLLMRYLRLNLVIDSLAGLLGNRHAYISLNIMAFFLRNCVRDRLLNGLAFFLSYSLALLLRNRSALLPRNLLAMFLRFIATLFLGNNLRNLFLDIFTHFSWNWPANWNTRGTAFLYSFIIHVLFWNHSAFLSGYIMALFSRFIPALLLGNIF